MLDGATHPAFAVDAPIQRRRPFGIPLIGRYVSYLEELWRADTVVKAHDDVEEVGPTKLKSGVFSPHPDNPNMTIVHSLDTANLALFPTWGLKMILKAKVTQSIDGSVKQYKASARYKKFVATNTSP